ncbi:hypothetical protein ACTXT7_001638 [Hymenolepis weldensis]
MANLDICFLLLSHERRTQTEGLIADLTKTNEMRRHAVIVSRKAKHSNLAITRFLKVATSFVCKVKKELLNENNGVTSTRTSKSVEEMINGYVRADPTEVPTTMHAREVSRYNSVANEKNPIFQQDSAPSHKALKTQDWMDSQEFSSSCHTKLKASELLIRP